jgi:hypothetical protein
MKMKQNKRSEKGDAFTNRLFLFLQSCRLPVTRITSLKKLVYKVETAERSYVVKGYTHYKKIRQQIYFLRALQDAGFSAAAYLQMFPDGSWYQQFASIYWLLVDYIEHEELFSFKNAANRHEGLFVLADYHKHAQRIPLSLLSYVPALSWLPRWDMRAAKFLYHREIAIAYLGEDIVTALLQWSAVSLSKLKCADMHALPHTFIHGDIIEHNFIKEDCVYLIDFDCVSLGPIMYDYIKYAYCILPYLNWSYETLCQYEYMHPFISEPYFLWSLIFPGDILREWDYFLFLSAEQRPAFEKQIVEFTKNKHKCRLAFVQKLYNMIT